jgi:hypothetical protein
VGFGPGIGTGAKLLKTASAGEQVFECGAIAQKVALSARLWRSEHHRIGEGARAQQSQWAMGIAYHSVQWTGVAGGSANPCIGKGAKHRSQHQHDHSHWTAAPNDRVQRRPTASAAQLLGVRWNPKLAVIPANLLNHVDS